MGQRKIKRMLAWVVPTLFLLLGIAGFSLLLSKGVSSLVGDLEFLDALGGEVELGRVGRYTLFWQGKEKPEIVDSDLPSLLSLKGIKTGETVKLSPLRFSSRYKYGGVVGWGLAELTISEPGMYQYSSPEVPIDLTEGSLALGREFNRRLVVIILLAMGFLMLIVLISLILFFRQIKETVETILQNK